MEYIGLLVFPGVQLLAFGLLGLYVMARRKNHTSHRTRILGAMTLGVGTLALLASAYCLLFVLMIILGPYYAPAG